MFCDFFFRGFFFGCLDAGSDVAKVILDRNCTVKVFALRKNNFDKSALNKSLGSLVGKVIILSLALNLHKSERNHKHLDKFESVLPLSVTLDFNESGTVAVNTAYAVLSTFKRCGVDSKVKAESLTLNVKLGNMRSSALEALARPRCSCFNTLVGEKGVFNFGVVILNEAFRLNKSCKE